MPPLVAAAAVTAGGALAGGAMASRSANNAANQQTAAANHAADVQAQSAREALAFQQQQAALDAARADAIQRANYEQWRAREGRISDFGSMVGLGPRSIPNYVPLPMTAAPPEKTPYTVPRSIGQLIDLPGVPGAQVQYTEPLAMPRVRYQPRTVGSYGL